MTATKFTAITRPTLSASGEKKDFVDTRSFLRLNQTGLKIKMTSNTEHKKISSKIFPVFSGIYRLGAEQARAADLMLS